MYRHLKRIIKGILPQSVLFRFEEILRWPMGLYYHGTRHECLICKSKLSSFVKVENGELICPSCGSLPRTRRLWKLLVIDWDIQGRVLHFSPSRSMYRRLRTVKSIDYISTDFENEFIADQKYDITNITEKDNSFDYIICYHVLEHIEADSQAMKELYRVLKPDGKAIIQTPFKEGEIYENPAVHSPEDRKIHFGQEDHFRIYSVKGLKSRLQNAGFQVEVKGFSEDNYHGLRAGETVLVAQKSNNPLRS